MDFDLNVSARSRLSFIERAFVVALAVKLCLLPWPLASQRPPAQILNVLLAAICFALALLRPGANARSLWLTPVTWIGITIVAYIGIQAFNPSWVYQSNEHFWWLKRIDSISWLPTSVRAPFSISNPWRIALTYVDCLLTSMAIWKGTSSRASLRILLTALSVNCCAQVMLFWYQRTIGTTRGPHLLADLTPFDLTASFISRNQASAYWLLCLTSTLGLAVWHARSGIRLSKRSTPAPLFLCIGGAISVTIIFSLSRGGILTMALALIAIGFLFVRTDLPAIVRSVPWVPIAILGTIAIAECTWLGIHANWQPIEQRMAALFIQRASEADVYPRIQAREAGEDALKDYWVRGAGAGCFRYIFPIYSQHYPEIYRNGSLLWEHLHCDWLELPLELGAAGDILFLGLFVTISRKVRFRGVTRNIVTTASLIACSATLLHATFDFPFQCPAIAVTWVAILTIGIKWQQLRDSSVVHALHSNRAT